MTDNATATEGQSDKRGNPNDMLIWIDLETTGLNPSSDKILEVACIITAADLNEVARFQAVTDEAANLPLSKLNNYVADMHIANGLWLESAATRRVKNWSAHQLHHIEQRLCELVAQHAPGAQLAGNTISFDRSFIQVHMPHLFELLHYRNLDVSSINEAARRLWPEVYHARPRDPAGVAHRAMPDIESSIATLRYYQTALGPIARAVTLKPGETTTLNVKVTP